MSGYGRSPEECEAGEMAMEERLRAETETPLDRLRRAGRAFVDAAREVAEELDPVDGSSDEAKSVAMATVEVAQLGAKGRAAIVDAVLLWLARNAGGERSLEVGELKFWGERGKKEKVRDMPKAVAALFGALEKRKRDHPGTYGQPLIAALGGDEDALAAVVRAVDDLVKSCVSTGGLKTGAARKILGDGFAEHWSVTWGDKLAKGEPAKKLGVANARFVSHHAAKKKS